MKEPTRPVHQPTVERDGSLVAHTVATPTAFKVRARVTVGSRKVIPVIFVPGVMGSNLRVRADAVAQAKAGPQPGEPAWRPPNGCIEAVKEAVKWSERSPAQRQHILDARILEVDPGGELEFAPYAFDRAVLRERGWGEVHADSYGALLSDLQSRLDKTFQTHHGKREIRDFWRRVIQCQPARWGVRSFEKITEAELEKYAAYQYPVYAFGYNWLDSCDISARLLRRRIDQIKKFWVERKHSCTKVILITHSMGGLVARACARMSETGHGGGMDIAGVIHAVMPALGAPVAYRRIACGTEGSHFTSTITDNLKTSAFVSIAGDTSAKTTPVMALSPGILQLLPNHFYPGPWLTIKTMRRVNHKDEVRDLLTLPDGNPYDFYRDMKSWYRMIDPDLANPGKSPLWSSGDVRKAIVAAIDEAERFHREVLTVGGTSEGLGKPYYHPNTYAFYGADSALKTYSQIRWVARETSSSHVALTPANVRAARLVGIGDGGARDVEIEQAGRLSFRVWPQDSHGDETVPVLSGAAPQAHVRQIFAPIGFRHQDSFRHDDMLLLTRHLIVKIVQEIQ